MINKQIYTTNSEEFYIKCASILLILAQIYQNGILQTSYQKLENFC